jgi:membrane associated rhomboid family serine protease
MGIADRDYTFGNRGRGGLGGFSFNFGGWSVTTWLIVVNVAVFVINLAASGYGVPVVKRIEGMYRWSDRLSPYYKPDPRNVLGAPVPGLDAKPEDLHRVGTPLFRISISPETKEAVGRVTSVVEPVVQSMGFFSTFTGFRQLEVWRLVTFQFLHANVPHIALNMFSLYMFAPVVEAHLGRRKFLAFYLACGIFGGLMYLLLNLLGTLLPLGYRVPFLLFHDTTTPLVGASAGCFGVIMACAYVSPNSEVMLPIPPITLRMRTLAYGYFLIALISLFLGSKNAGGEAAHVGGALAGFYFIRNSHLLRDFFDVLNDSRRDRPMRNPGRSSNRSTASNAGAKNLRLVRPPPPPQVSRDDARMDEILAKISKSGRESLTRDEQEFLRRQTERRQQSPGNGGNA